MLRGITKIALVHVSNHQGRHSRTNLVHEYNALKELEQLHGRYVRHYHIIHGFEAGVGFGFGVASMQSTLAQQLHLCDDLTKAVR